MPALDPTLSEGFHADDVHRLTSALRDHLTVGEPQYRFRRSADPSLASFIQLIGGAALWVPLTTAATVFLSTLARRAGDATWDGLAFLFRQKEVKPLADVARALTDTARKADGKVEIVVGLNVPDNCFGTAMIISAENPEEVARLLAHFVLHAGELSRMMQAEIDAGRAPLGRAIIELRDDGSLLVKWLDRNFCASKNRFPLQTVRKKLIVTFRFIQSDESRRTRSPAARP